MRPHFPRSASRQVSLIGCVFVVAGAIVLVLGLGQLQRARGDLDRLDRRLLPGTVRLASADRHLTDAARRFRTFIDAPGAGTNSPELGAITDAHNQGAAHWRAFKTYARALPGTRHLIRGIDADIESLAETGARLLSSRDAGDVTRYDATVAAMDRDLGSLDERFTRAIEVESAAARADADTTLWTALSAYGVALFAIVTVTIVAAKRARRREVETARSDAERARHADREQLASRMQRGLEMTRDESESFEVADAALRVAFDATPVELLVADSTRDHLHRVAGTTDGPAVGSSCAVTSPGDCPATRRNQTMQFAHNDALDACPFLRRRPGGACSATCVPIGVMGKSTGVVCAIGTPHQPADQDSIAQLELVARKMGERLTLLRSFARTNVAASTDPLTNLANRRSLEDAARSLTDAGRPYVVAFADLDRFKRLNDEHGHDTGDQALRLFARILRDSVRPGDFPARYGGEEFVVILPDCTVSDATRVLDRVRSALHEAVVASELPEFTVSFGLSAPDAMRSFEDVVTEADAALMVAKASGRDRVVGPMGPAGPERLDDPAPLVGLVTTG
jgi:diguanylate cyclase (GGDEF)-like protein